MKYSLVHEERCEAQPKLSGHCPACGEPTIAKCGEVKIWHWAHKGKRMCDPWWENETDWHRNWKNCFPVDWQEFVQYDVNGERHIADVKTIQGYVIEFQHSYLNPEERKARTEFYGKLVWVVDGTKRPRDKKQFIKTMNDAGCLCIEPLVKVVGTYNCALLSKWSGLRTPVFFDFGDETLYCLLPVFIGSRSYFVEFPRRLFIERHNKSADQTDNTFEDCLQKLTLFASEHRRNELYRIKHNVYAWRPRKYTQREFDICKKTSDHLIMLHERFQIVMKPYFGTNNL